MKKSIKLILIFMVNLCFLGGVVFLIVKSGGGNEAQIKVPETPPQEKVETPWAKIAVYKLQTKSARAMVFVREKDFLVADDAGITAYSEDRKQLGIIPVTGEIVSLAVDKIIIYAALPRQIVKINGSTIKRWPELDSRTRLTSIVLSGGRLFAADAGNRKIYCFDENGKKLWESAGAEGEKFVVPSPYFDMVPDGDGGVWIVNPGRHRIENYAKDGKFKAQWKPLAANAFSGCCNPAYLGILSGDRFVTLEKGTVRVKLFAPSGEMIEYVVPESGFNPGGFRYDLKVLPDEKIAILDGYAGEIKIYARRNHEK